MNKEISISIRLPNENCTHTHTAEIPFKYNEEPLAEDVLKQFILLMENVYGETATRDAINKL